MPRSHRKRYPCKGPIKDPSSTVLATDVSDLLITEQNTMIARAIRSAYKHGVDISGGRRNAGAGNCAFESALFNVNDRSCFKEKFPHSIDHYRRVWVTDMKNRTLNDATWKIGSDLEWEAGWEELLESGVYERGIFGDLMLLAIACGLKKFLLIFNTSINSPHDPIYVCDPRKFGVAPDTDIPVVLCYNMSHYESLHPIGNLNEQRTSNLVKQYLDGKYSFGRNDLAYLLESDSDDSKSCSSVSSVAGEEKGKQLKRLNENLPNHLKGRRPSEMSQEEKRKYRKQRKQFESSLCSKLKMKVFEADHIDYDLIKDNIVETKVKWPLHLQGKRPKDMTPEEKREYDNIRRKQSRRNESKVTKAARKDSDRKNKAAKRSTETEGEKKTRKGANAKAMSEKRSRETEQEKTARLEANAKAMFERRLGETERKKKARKEANAKAMFERRSGETEKEKKARKEADAKSTAMQRKNKIPTSKYQARNANMVFEGKQIVLELKDSTDGIGSMGGNQCKFCQAKKWKKETSTVCCINGKVLLPIFPDPPQILQDLLTSNTAEARLFRQNTRTINNALALSSLQVQVRQFSGGFAPCIVFEGKVCQKIGPLFPEEGNDPKFAQLYIHDPATEHTIRIRNMNLPDHMNKKDIDMMENILLKLQDMLKAINPFVKDLIHICEIPEEQLSAGTLVISCKERPTGSHERRYNAQQSLTEVSVLTNCIPGDMVIRKRGGGLQEIYDIHPVAQPLHFVLLFPFGTKGYHADLKHVDMNKRVSPREFFAYHINMRSKDSDFLFRFGRLFQEYLCLAFTTIESQRLKYQRDNQKALRADSFKNVKDILAERMPIVDKITSDDHNLKIGKKIILSSSFPGSPRWYNAKFQDGMAICRKYRKPDLFITFTCNPYWEEIIKELRDGEIVQDRPDLVSRVFKLKKDQLIKDIKDGQIFGKVSAYLWVIEFQKRGLPHAHILVILSEADRPNDDNDVDNMISAQLPPDPEKFPPNSKEREQATRLQDIILKNMVHGPCGELNPSSPCMQDGKCTKGYPKSFNEKTFVKSEKCYPEYQRLDPAQGGRSIILKTKSKQFVIDNKWIVPYSPYLSLRFNCHINIELCFSPTASKYLFKYVTKGEDRAMVRAEIEAEELVKDEIKDFVDLRSVGSSEASWHIFNFNISQNKPAVYTLRVHLKDEQQVVFDVGSEEEMLEKQKFTELTAFFEYNQDHPDTKVTYVEFPEHFTYDTKKHKWKARKNVSETIGRVHTVHPLAGDVYYLRMLLHHSHCQGKTSFEDLLCVGNDQCESYQVVARMMGLLQDDQEWEEALAEGALTKMPSALRELFVTIIIFCVPSNPKELFNNHYSEWADDFIHKASKTGISLTDTQIRTLVVLDIQQRLQSFDKDLYVLGIESPTKDELDNVAFTSTSTYPVLIREELDFDIENLKKCVEERRSKFTDSQEIVFKTVMEAIQNGKPLSLFIDARGGTGKTFVLNAILAAVRSLDSGTVGLAVGTTGIAANLLQLGRTLHSRFKVPLNITNESVCGVSSQSTLADLIRKARIIVWDEAPMSHKFQMEAVDRTLRDITGCNLPFGGKVTVLSGDFRQCLPVIPHANRAEVVNSALSRSYLWSSFIVLPLKENMRVRLNNNPDTEWFDNFTLLLGDGSIENIQNTDLIRIPEDMCLKIEPKSLSNPDAEETAMNQLISHVYPNLQQNFKLQGWMEGRAILAPTNKEVDRINNLIADTFPGKPSVLSSSDELLNPDDFQRFNQEYLNSLLPSGLPNHRLFIKSGMPLMLMRNLNPKMGLCNGTRLIFKRLHKNHLLECKIVGGEYQNRSVLIPRVTLRPKEREFPFEWSRRQFPVRVAFAMTINKSQGQTLKNVGVWLKDPCFAHGQLYVAMSRVGSSKDIKFAIRSKDGFPDFCTSNVVYKEALI